MTNLNIHDDNLLYSAEDAQHILQIAIAQQAETGELSRTQLLEIADELGISITTMLEAEREWDVRKHELADQQVFDRQRKEQFQHGAARFGIFGGFLLVFNMLVGGHLTWLLYLVFGPWSLMLVWNAWRIYRPNTYHYTQEFQRWRRKKQVGQVVNGLFRRLVGP